MAIIDIDWRDTMNKADQLDDLAEELQHLIYCELTDMEDGAGSRWQGSAAELYRKKARTYVRQIQSEQKNLRSLARGLRKTAETYRDLEQLGKSLFGG